MKPSQHLISRVWESLPWAVRGFLWKELQIGSPPWQAEECISRVDSGDTSSTVYTYLCPENHRNYIVEISSNDRFLCALFIEDVAGVIDSLESARDAVHADCRRELED